jgi:hypothetical protein
MLQNIELHGPKNPSCCFYREYFLAQNLPNQKVLGCPWYGKCLLPLQNDVAFAIYSFGREMMDMMPVTVHGFKGSGV